MESLRLALHQGMVALKRASGALFFKASQLDPANWLWLLAIAIALAGVAVILLHMRRRRTPVRSLLDTMFVIAVAAAAALPLIFGFERLPAMLGACLLGIGAAAALGRVAGTGRRLDRGDILAATVPIAAAVALLAGARERAHFSERSLVIEQMLARPSDPWPRGEGHVPLGRLGAAAADKAYLEPGGSFSPAVASFGVSIWVRDGGGTLVATSDSLPLRDTRHRYAIDSAGDPSITIATPYYAAVWTMPASGGSRLRLIGRRPGFALELAVRGVGPAGAALRDLRWRNGALDVGGRWTIGSSAKLAAVGSEHDGGWTDAAAAPRDQAHDAGGWAYARFAVPAEEGGTLTIERQARVPAGPGLPAGTPLRLSGGDPAFRQALDAQRTTLLLGLVGDGTRPGEPINYPLEWQRDGAYTLVALARSGQVALAQRLAVRFIQRDFFGGFGAEADAPGLALWALAEIVAAGDDAAFARQVWPIVVRRAAQIEAMAATRVPLRADYAGPIVPEQRWRADLAQVAYPARAGMIDGRMDLHRPIFFINGVTYAGLHGAGAIAAKLGRPTEAARWSALAERLGRAWRQAFVEPAFSHDVADDRTAIVGLWPAGIADRGRYEMVLERRWKAEGRADGTSLERPLWTYFTVAEAHQWLRLGRPDRSWAVLRELWAEQPIPGLYTLWEGRGEENSFGLWQQVRGWVAPHEVTPHYWSAAEMLLLQLEMLAYADRNGIVIGAGVPRAWLAQPLAVDHIQTGRGPLGWRWDGHAVSVWFPSRTIAGKLRLGSGFPAGTPIRTVSARPPGPRPAR